MKRAGHLMERIVQRDNLAEAFLRAVRGKATNADAIHFRSNIDWELERMGNELASGEYRFGRYERFLVHDPKRRIICAAPFRDRVAMHAMMRICHPVFDSYQVAESFASRPGMGTRKALEHARHLVRCDTWFVKMDVCSFFPSISHDVMLGQLERLFKDRLLLTYFERLIRDYEVTPGRGLPIGNLTSQYFANHNLSPADHFLKEKLRVGGIVRYMDDTLLTGSDRDRLMDYASAYTAFVGERLRLRLHAPVVNRCCGGVPFLGYVLFPDGRVHLSLRSRRRFRRQLASLTDVFTAGVITEAAYQERLTALFSFISYADDRTFRRAVLSAQGFLP